MGEWFFIDSLSADCSVVFFPCGLTGDAGLVTGVARIPSVSPWEEVAADGCSLLFKCFVDFASAAS